MITCTRRLSFDAGHRVWGHQGKCRHLHGHRYDVDVVCYATNLNELGMVIDFGVVKEKVGKWIDDNLDHNMLLYADDPLLVANNVLGTIDPPFPNLFVGKAPFIMTSNPTAENIAALIYTHAVRLLFGSKITIQNVRVYETPNCWADYPGPPVAEIPRISEKP